MQDKIFSFLILIIPSEHRDSSGEGGHALPGHAPCISKLKKKKSQFFPQAPKTHSPGRAEGNEEG